MTMPEMQKAISKLRLLLASIKHKEEEVVHLSRQFERQLSRAPTNAIHGESSLDATLGIMSEIQERLDDSRRVRDHLAAIRKRTEDELQALELTDRIEQAKAELADLRSSLKANGRDDESERRKIVELERFIDEASQRAAEAITGSADVPRL